MEMKEFFFYVGVCLIGPHPEEPWLGGCGFNTGGSILLHPQSGHCLWDPGQSHWASRRELLHIYIVCVGGGGKNEWWGYVFSYPGLYYRFLLRFFFFCPLHFFAFKGAHTGQCWRSRQCGDAGPGEVQGTSTGPRASWWRLLHTSQMAGWGAGVRSTHENARQLGENGRNPLFKIHRWGQTSEQNPCFMFSPPTGLQNRLPLPLSGIARQS